MVFGKSGLELKVGVFVFVGLVILAIFVLFIGDFKLVTSSYRMNFIFNFINGVKVGSPVRYAGVAVGEVREINFIFREGDPKPRVQVVGWIRNEIKIPADSQVWVNTLGLLGEKYVEIIPGKDFGHLLPAGTEMEGNDPFAMQEFGELAKSVTEKLDKTLSGVEQVASSINKLAVNVDDGITRIKNGEGSVGKIIYGDTLYQEIEALVVDLRRHPWKLFWKGKETTSPKKKKKK